MMTNRQGIMEFEAKLSVGYQRCALTAGVTYLLRHCFISIPQWPQQQCGLMDILLIINSAKEILVKHNVIHLLSRLCGTSQRPNLISGEISPLRRTTTYAQEWPLHMRASTNMTTAERVWLPRWTVLHG
jgi:hypothetical protein